MNEFAGDDNAQDQILLLQKTFQDLLSENIETKKLAKEHEIKIGEMRAQIRRLEGAEKRRRLLLVMGSVASNFISACLQTVFGKTRYFETKAIKQLSCCDEIEAYPKTTEEEALWARFKDKYWKYDHVDKVLDELMREGGLGLAHPKTIAEDDIEPPTPAELQVVVAQCFRNKSQKEFRQRVNDLIDDLDVITRDLGRPILG